MFAGVIQKEKVGINFKKGAQISVLANNIATNWWPNNIAIKESKLYITFIFTTPLCCYLIKKLELGLMAVRVLLKINFRHVQISVPKIGIPTFKTVCMKLWFNIKESLLYMM